MKNMMKVLALLALGTLAVGCGGNIPSAYQGTFKDNTRNVTITLASDKGTATFADGHTLSAGASDVNFDNLAKGQAGIYTRPNSQNNDLIEVIWISPVATSLQSNSGLVWYQAEILYTLANSKQSGNVATLELSHCLQGEVELDTTNQDLQFGCPAGADDLNTVRTSSN